MINEVLKIKSSTSIYLNAPDESNELSKLIVENSHDGIMLIDENYTIEFVNDQLCQLTTYFKDELIGKDFRTLLSNEQKEIIIDRHGSREEGINNKSDFVLYFKTKKNTEKIFEIKSTLFYDKKNNSKTLSQFKDITESKYAEEKLVQSEEKFRSIVENSHLGIMMIDSNFYFEYVNEQFSKIIHYSREELEGTDFRKYVAQESLELVVDRYRKRQNGIPVPSEYEVKLLCQDGEEKIVRLSSTVITVSNTTKTIAQVLDITENIKKEKLQEVLLKISQAVNEVKNLSEFLETVRAELSEIIDTKNFYVAMYDSNSDTYTFPYHVDEYDSIDEITQIELKDSLTDFVRRKNKAILVDAEMQNILEDNGEIKGVVGESCPVWLGAPLVVDNIVVGVIGIQNYHLADAFTLNDLELLKIVSENVSSAIWRKQTIDKLTVSEHRYRDFISRTSEGIYRIDFDPPVNINQMAKKQVNEIFKNAILGECNNSFSEMYGIESPGKIIGENLNVFYGNRISEEIKKAYLDFVNGDYKITDVETIEYNIHGDKINILNNSIGIIKNNHLHNIWGIQKDITESKKVQNVVKQIAEGISTSIGDSFFKSTVRFIGETLKVNYVFIAELSEDKKSAESMAFWEKDGIKENFVYQLKNSPSNKVLKNNKTLYIENIDELFPNDNFFRELKIKSYLGKTLVNSDGDPIGLIAIFDENKFQNVEFTKSVLEIFASRSSAELERLQYVKALVAAKELAERSDILKTEFLAQMSHEIRTPVNTILSFSSLLKESLQDKLDEELKDSFKIIDNGGRRLIRTIDLILNVSQIQSGNLTITPTKLIITSILKDLMSEFAQEAKKKNISFTFKCENESVFINGDNYTIIQIFANLIHNAIKYTPKGNIGIEVKETKRKNVIVKVIDSGVGMHEEFLNKIFDPFSQEESGYTRKFEGTGLGLTLVRKYCELNNATINIESIKNEGSTFLVKFNK